MFAAAKVSLRCSCRLYLLAPLLAYGSTCVSARKQASAGRLRGRLPRRRASLLDAPDADGKEINSCNNAASCPRIVPRALPHFIMLRATSRRSAPRPSRNSSSRRARHEHSGRVAAAPRRRGSGRRDSVDRAARQTGQSDRKWTGEDTLWTAHASHQISDSLLSVGRRAVRDLPSPRPRPVRDFLWTRHRTRPDRKTHSHTT